MWEHLGSTCMLRVGWLSWEQVADITFHHLRHDFGYHLRASDFTLEEVVASLGHVTKKGTPAVGTTARYTPPNREQMKRKLKDVSS